MGRVREKPSDFWDYINNLYEKRLPVCSDTERIGSLFQICRFLSYGSSSFVPASDATFFALKLPDWAVACYLYNAVPEMKKAPWVKKIGKSEKKGIDPLLVEKLGHVLCCSPRHVEETVAILGRIGIDVYSLFGLEKKRSG